MGKTKSLVAWQLASSSDDLAEEKRLMWKRNILVTLAESALPFLFGLVSYVVTLMESVK